MTQMMMMPPLDQQPVEMTGGPVMMNQGMPPVPSEPQTLVAGNQNPGNSFGGFLSGFGDWLGNNASGLAQIGSIWGALDNASDIRDLGYATQQHLENMGKDLNTGSQFQGYGVTSGLGSSTVGQNGSINLGVGPDSWMQSVGDGNMVGGTNALQNAAGMDHGQSTIDYSGYTQDAMNKSLADPSQRQGEIFDQLMAMQNPTLNTMQAQTRAQEHAMGRGGLAGSQHGGTSEDAAMARARMSAMNEASLGAMKQADAERQMYGQMGANYGGLGNQAMQAASQYGGMLSQAGQALNQAGIDQHKLSYMPMQMQMELLNQAQATGGMAQQGQLTGQDYLAQLLLGGANANINAQNVASQLTGNLYDSILDNLGGSSTTDSSKSGLGGMLSNIGDLIGGLFGG